MSLSITDIEREEMRVALGLTLVQAAKLSTADLRLLYWALP